MKTLLTLGVLSIVLASCSYDLSPYTSYTQSQTNFNEDQLKKVQFFLTGDITLYRSLGASETQITGGEIKIVNGEKVEQIVISNTTPGVVIGKEGEVLLVSFDADGSYLRFGPNKDYGGKYTMMAKEWQGSTGIVEYAGRDFKSTPQSIYAYLSVNMERINNSTTESKHAGEGR